jgi:hypothetical protein
MPSPNVLASTAARATSRRSDPRIEVLGHLNGTLVSRNVLLNVANMSAGGFAVDSPVPFPAGTIHRFRFTTPLGEIVVIDASVMHCRRTHVREGANRYMAGFEFVHDSDSDAKIAQLLDAATSVVSFQ